MYQNGENMANGRKMYQIVIKYTKTLHSEVFQNVPKFGMKIYHLATLADSCTVLFRQKKAGKNKWTEL
jgi:hypothetical protein